MVNKVTLIGRLGRDPELRYTSSQTAVCNFSLATDEVYQDRNRQRQSRTEWHNIVAWDRLAEICGQYLNKGKLVYIEGRLQTREWDDRDGNRRRTTEIVAREMKMLGAPGDSQGARPNGQQVARPEGPMDGGHSDPYQDRSPAPAPSGRPAGETSDSMEIGITDDDIPF